MTTPLNNQVPSQNTQGAADVTATNHKDQGPGTQPTHPANNQGADVRRSEGMHNSDHHPAAGQQSAGPGHAEQEVKEAGAAATGHHTGRDQHTPTDPRTTGQTSGTGQTFDNQGTAGHHTGTNEPVGQHGRAEQEIKNAGAAATGHHAGRDQNTPTGPRATGQTSGPGQTFDNQGSTGHHTGHHAGTDEPVGQHGRAEQEVKNAGAAATGHHVGRDQNTPTGPRASGQTSGPGQTFDNQGAPGHHTGHHAGKNEPVGQHGRAEQEVENAGAAATGHHIGSDRDQHTTDPRTRQPEGAVPGHGHHTSAPGHGHHPGTHTGADQPVGAHQTANVAGAAATGHHAGQTEQYRDVNNAGGTTGAVDQGRTQPPQQHAHFDQTQAAPAAGGQTYPPQAGTTTAGTGAAHPDATRGSAAGGTFGKGIKGIVKGVHGAGEAIRGNINQGVDEAFGHHEGVTKNQGVAQQGVEEMRGAGNQGTAATQRPPPGGNRV